MGAFTAKRDRYTSKIKDNPTTQRTPRQIQTYLHSSKLPISDFNMSYCVIDSYGEWMTQWAKQFDVLGISHLRSTVSVHPDAFDMHTLLTWAADQNREDELTDIEREIRGPKFKGPFWVPSVSLFWDFCCDFVDRWHLQERIHKGTVASVEPSGNPDYKYEIRLYSGKTVHANHVVLALGNTLKRLPDWAEDVYDPATNLTCLHTSDLTKMSSLGGLRQRKRNGGKAALKDQYSNFDVESNTCKSKSDLDIKKISSSNAHDDLTGYDVLIVGGGLSSGHLSIRASLLGARTVYMVCRSALKTRQFDLELDWIGRNRFNKLAEFYSVQTDEERLEVIQRSRSGGSITPSVVKELRSLEKQGKLIIHEECDVWHCQLSNKGSNNQHYSVDLSNGETLQVDRVWFATGSRVNALEEPLLSNVATNFKLPTLKGLPVLSEQLEWGSDTGLYVMGVYASLRLGPDALNLAGGRGGASRIADRLKKLS